MRFLKLLLLISASAAMSATQLCPMMSAALHHPIDDLPRLVFADFLDEYGKETAAELLRTDVAMHHTNSEFQKTQDADSAALLHTLETRRATLLKSLGAEAEAFAIHGDWGIDPFAYTYDETDSTELKNALWTTLLDKKTKPSVTFTMGSPPNEAGRFDNEVQHQETIRLEAGAYALEVMKIPVTQFQFAAVMGTNPSYFKMDSFWTWRNMMIDPVLPVENISWNTAQDYVKALNTIHASRQGGPLYRYRLLHENEWEYAARGGKDTPFFWGADGDVEAKKYAWLYRNSKGKTQAVGKLNPNDFGMHDTSGNIWEWVEDLYAGNGSSRVLRGGSWYSNRLHARSAYRFSDYPGDAYDGVGLRLARIRIVP